jgi:hypothetical protein
MGTVLALGTGLHVIARRSKILLIAVVIAAMGFIAPAGDLNTVFASQIGTLNATPVYTDLDSTVTATVFDPDLNVTVLREFEATDSTGNLYELPVGNAGSSTVFKLSNTHVGDFNADGSITAADLQISTTNAVVQWVNKKSGTFQTTHSQNVASTENFTVTYRSEHKDTTSITLRTASDPAGFTLSLEETTPTSHSFVATFKTGEATVSTGADDATSTTRPIIKVAEGDTVTLEYADASPAKLISEAVVIDATKPSVSITSPIHLSSTSDTTAWVRVVVTDAAAGVELDQIKFHVDVDRDEIFDEPGEIITASAAESTKINQGWNVVALLPAISPDGLVNWYVTATDRASNVRQSDSEATAGDQFHKYTVDTAPPSVVELVLGGAYDETSETIVDNVLNSVRIKWSEPIKESLIDETRFIINGQAAISAVMFEDPDLTEDDENSYANTVYLTFEDIPTTAKLITIRAGAVSDLTEFPSPLKEIMPIDKLGPRLAVSTDTAITNGLLTINVSTVETLAADPTVTINGVTFGSAQPVDTNKWTIVVDGTTFTGSAAGDGVKNVEAAGFDKAGNFARGGVAVEAAGNPEGAIQFDLDTVIKTPIVLPGDREVSIVPRPMITVSFAAEIGEYSGDTHSGVTIISAKLDGQDVTSEFMPSSAATWSYQPGDLSNTEHTLEITGRDDAGNTSNPVFRVFNVDAPPPTATPVPTETPVVVPTIEAPPAENPTDSGDSTPATAVPSETPADTEPPAESAPEVPVVAEPVPSPDAPADSGNSGSNVVPETEAPTDTADPEQAPPAAPVDDVVAEEPDPETLVDDDSASDTDDTADDANPDAEADPEDPAEDEELTNDDIAATVAAMRADDELDGDEAVDGEEDPSLAPEPALTVFGCNVPSGPEEAVGGVIAGADYLLAAAGLFGLIVARARPKRRKRADREDTK